MEKGRWKIVLEEGRVGVGEHERRGEVGEGRR